MNTKILLKVLALSVCAVCFTSSAAADDADLLVDLFISGQLGFERSAAGEVILVPDDDVVMCGFKLVGSTCMDVNCGSAGGTCERPVKAWKKVFPPDGEPYLAPSTWHDRCDCTMP